MNNSETNALVAKIDAYYDKKVELIRKHEKGEISTLEYNTLMDELEDGTSFMNRMEEEELDDNSAYSLHLLNKWATSKYPSYAI